MAHHPDVRRDLAGTYQSGSNLHAKLIDARHLAERLSLSILTTRRHPDHVSDEGLARQANAWRDAGWDVDIDTEPSQFAAYDEVCLEARGISVHAWVSQVGDEVIVMGSHRREMDWAEFMEWTVTPSLARKMFQRRG